jgi:hypothetical protein
MTKHQFGITCPNTLLVGSALGPLEHEKERVDVSRTGHTRTHYVNTNRTRCKNTTSV